MATAIIRDDFISLNSGPTVEWFGLVVLALNMPAHRPGLYVLINLVNGKLYIGMAEDVARRLRAHAMNNSPKKLKVAIKKYGKASFLAVPLFYALDGTEALEPIETLLIAEHDAIDRGYNICAANGRVGPYGPAHSAAVKAGFTKEGRARTTEAARLNYPRTQEAFRAGQRAYNDSEEGRKANSERMKRQWENPEWAAATITKLKATLAATKAQRSEKIRKSWEGAEQRRAKTAVQTALIMKNPASIAKMLNSRQKTQAAKKAALAQTTAAGPRQLRLPFPDDEPDQ
jgi:group I intron endonuclease